MFKKIFCIVLCLICSFICTSCENNSEHLSTNASQQNDSFVPSYKFNEIKDVQYYCARNIPGNDVVYVISKVLTDTGRDISGLSDLYCKNEDIKIDDMVITIPYNYTKRHRSLKLTVVHRTTEISYDFTLKFEKKWNLIFEDNFDGTKLNTDVWNVWDFDDWQYFYSPDSIFLDGKGNLVNRVSILEEPNPENDYTKQTGAITTLDKFQTTYGYYEVRMIPNLTSGMWSAFWLVGGDMSDKDAADDGSAVNGFEVDVVETYYYRTDPAQTIHWDGYYNDQTKTEHYSLSGADHIFDGNFHTFAFRWDENEYAFMIDGVVTKRMSKMGICNQPSYLLLSAHYGPAGDLILSPGEYSDMIVDYVKVYQSPNDPT